MSAYTDRLWQTYKTSIGDVFDVMGESNFRIAVLEAMEAQRVACANDFKHEMVLITGDYDREWHRTIMDSRVNCGGTSTEE